MKRVTVTVYNLFLTQIQATSEELNNLTSITAG
jgi:hypothetical protein